MSMHRAHALRTLIAEPDDTVLPALGLIGGAASSVAVNGRS